MQGKNSRVFLRRIICAKFKMIVFYGVVGVLVCFSFFLVLLLTPIPKSLAKVLISLLNKLNSPMLFWPARVFFCFLLFSVVNAFLDMKRTQGLPSSVQHERYFVVTCVTAVLVLVTWRVQAVIRYQKKLEVEIEDFRSKLHELKRQLPH